MKRTEYPEYYKRVEDKYKVSFEEVSLKEVKYLAQKDAMSKLMYKAIELITKWNITEANVLFTELERYRISQQTKLRSKM